MKTLGIVLALVAVAGFVNAEPFMIRSFQPAGSLTFNAMSNATSYRVEWASSPAGPWTNFSGGAAGLNAITATGEGVVTAAVPLTAAALICYRAVADIANYLVVDLSGGPTASSYPVSYLTNVPAGGWTDEYKTTKMVFRQIPAGTFVMGSPADELGRDSDEIQHQVTLTQPFCMGVFKVTQRQWEQVMGTWPSYFTNASYRDARPVELVRYNDIRGATAGAGWPASNNVDATSFMGTLRARTGRGFDLPTESQWEYAGRAGTATALNSGYNLTNTSSDAHMAQVGRYWYNGGSSGLNHQNDNTSVGTAKVGSYLPNQWGLYDMHGNVWEECLDWYGTYPGTASDPNGATTGLYRVLRGGSWGAKAYDCRVAHRASGDPRDTGIISGFRVALPPGQ